MKILLLGSGGREHALAWKMAQSPLCDKLFIAPGNAGTATCGENATLSLTDFDGIKKFALEQGVEMVVVGPEDPLVNGIWDAIRNDPATGHILVIGPSAAGAQLEGSNSFCQTIHGGLWHSNGGLPRIRRDFDRGRVAIPGYPRYPDRTERMA